MYKIFLISFLSLFFTKLFGTNYYVDSNSNPNGTGLSISSPFNRLQKINTLVLFPGDSILLKRGSLFREELNVRQSGSISQPIYIGAYGDGALPIISGANVHTGWVKKGNIYRSGCNYCQESIPQVFIGNLRHVNARFPNSGYFTIQNCDSNSFFSASLIQGGGAWDSANVFVKTQPWVLDKFLIGKYSTGKVVIAPSKNFYKSYPFQKNFGFFISSSEFALDSIGEYYYNKKSKIISIIPNDEIELVENGLEIPIRKSCISLYDVDNVIISNLNLEKAARNAISISLTNNVSILSSVLRNAGNDGIGGFEDYFTTNSNLRIENCQIYDIGNVAINLVQGKRVIIKNNIIKRIGLIPGLGAGVDNGYEGIYCRASYSRITGNVLDSIGYNGIHIKSNDTVQYNKCSNFGLTKTDCGGVYFWRGENNYVTNNLISNGYGNSEGTTISNGFATSGIFCDDFSKSNFISDNTCVNNERGIMIHNSRNNLIQNNVLYDNRSAQLMMREGSPNAPEIAMAENTIVGNTFQCVHPSQLAMVISLEKDNIKILGNIDKNLYSNPYNIRLVGVSITTKYNQGLNAVQYNRLTLDEFKLKYGYEKNNIQIIPSKSAYATFQKTSENLVLNSQFSNNLDGWYAIRNSNFNISLNFGVPNMYGGALRTSNNNDTSMRMTQWSYSPVKIQENKDYLFTYRVASDKVGGAKLVLNQQTEPYRNTTIPYLYYVSFPKKADNDTILLRGNANMTAYISFTNSGIDGTVWMDNVALTEVNVDTSFSLPHKRNALFTNDSSSNIKLDVANKYQDINNKIIENDILLAPFSSIVLLKIETDEKLNKNSSRFFNVYPNPSYNRELNISSKTSGELSVEILDKYGKSVFFITLYGSDIIKLPESIKSGMYFVKVTNSKVQEIKKILLIQ